MSEAFGQLLGLLIGEFICKPVCRLTCPLLASARVSTCHLCTPEAALPLAKGDTVRVLVGPRSENWALARVAAVHPDGTVDVSFEENCCCCAAGYGDIEMTEAPGDGGRCYSRPLKAAGIARMVTLDKLQTAGRRAIQVAPELLAVSQPKLESSAPAF